MKNLKKILSLVLAVMMIVSVAVPGTKVSATDTQTTSTDDLTGWEVGSKNTITGNPTDGWAISINAASGVIGKGYTSYYNADMNVSNMKIQLNLSTMEDGYFILHLGKEKYTSEKLDGTDYNVRFSKSGAKLDCYSYYQSTQIGYKRFTDFDFTATHTFEFKKVDGVYQPTLDGTSMTNSYVDDFVNTMAKESKGKTVVGFFPQYNVRNFANVNFIEKREEREFAIGVDKIQMIIDTTADATNGSGVFVQIGDRQYDTQTDTSTALCLVLDKAADTTLNMYKMPGTLGYKSGINYTYSQSHVLHFVKEGDVWYPAIDDVKLSLDVTDFINGMLASSPNATSVSVTSYSAAAESFTISGAYSKDTASGWDARKNTTIYGEQDESVNIIAVRNYYGVATNTTPVSITHTALQYRWPITNANRLTAVSLSDATLGTDHNLSDDDLYIQLYPVTTTMVLRAVIDGSNCDFNFANFAFDDVHTLTIGLNSAGQYVPLIDGKAAGYATDTAKTKFDAKVRTLIGKSLYWRVGTTATGDGRAQIEFFTDVKVTSTLGDWSVQPELESAINFNYKVQLGMTPKTGTVPSMTFANDNYGSITVDGKLGADGKYSFDLELLPQWIAEEITATLSMEAADGTVVQETKTYSMKEYCHTVLNDANSSDELKDLIVDLMKYGATAQRKFGLEETITADLTLEQMALGSSDVATALTSQGEGYVSTPLTGENVETYRWKSVSVMMDNQLMIRCKFTTTVGIDNLTINAQIAGYDTVAYTGDMIGTDSDSTGTYYYIDVPIYPYEYAKNVTVSFADQEAATLSYSVNTYLYNIYNKATTTDIYKSLMTAINCYGWSANAYVNSITE